MNDVLGWIISIILVVIAAFLYRLPHVWQDKMIETLKNKNSSQLQKEAFFKEIAGAKQKEIFDRWTKRLTYMDQDDEDMQELVHNTILFGSADTVSLLADFMQYIFTHPSKKDKHGKDIDPDSDYAAMMMAYIAVIASKLKEDFSGISIDPINIIKMKISDFNVEGKNYENAIDIVNKQQKLK